MGTKPLIHVVIHLNIRTCTNKAYFLPKYIMKCLIDLPCELILICLFVLFIICHFGLRGRILVQIIHLKEYDFNL